MRELNPDIKLFFGPIDGLKNTSASRTHLTAIRNAKTGTVSLQSDDGSDDGRNLLDPLVMLRCRKEVLYRIQSLHNATSTKSRKYFIRSIVSPAIQAEKRANALNSMIENEGDSLSKNTKYRLWNLLCPEDIMSRGNKAIKSRTDTAKNPLGGLSLAAG